MEEEKEETSYKCRHRERSNRRGRETLEGMRWMARDEAMEDRSAQADTDRELYTDPGSQDQ
jgi:hypothetical protein